MPAFPDTMDAAWRMMRTLPIPTRLPLLALPVLVASALVTALPSRDLAAEENDKAVLRRTDRDPPPVGERLDEPFTADAVHVRLSNQSIIGNTILDAILETGRGRARKLAEAAHRDAIRLIPENPFAAGVLEKLVIRDNAIRSAGALQGIFGSDGVFRQVTITGNTIDTASAHKVMLNGLVGRGNRIEGNRDAAGRLVAVELNPIRLGGNAGTGNVWVLSVVPEDEAEYGFGEIDIGRDGTREHIRDNRRVAPPGAGNAKGDIGLRDFPMTRFKQELAGATIQAMLDHHPALVQEVDAWMTSLAALPENRHDATRVEMARKVFTQQRRVPIAELDRHSREVQCFFIQALARTLGTPVAIGANGGGRP